jgi:hypothetical protein
MARRQLLTDEQWARLLAPPNDEREIVRHYTLSRDDLDLIGGKRSGHSRLGFAVLLCYMRHPGRVLEANEIPPPELLSFIADRRRRDGTAAPSAASARAAAVKGAASPRDRRTRGATRRAPSMASTIEAPPFDSREPADTPLPFPARRRCRRIRRRSSHRVFWPKAAADSSHVKQ